MTKEDFKNFLVTTDIIFDEEKDFKITVKELPTKIYNKLRKMYKVVGQIEVEEENEDGEMVKVMKDNVVADEEEVYDFFEKYLPELIVRHTIEDETNIEVANKIMNDISLYAKFDVEYFRFLVQRQMMRN